MGAARDPIGAPAPPLSGERARLRPIDAADLGPLVAILAEPAVREWWGAYDEARLRRDLDDEDVRAWAIEVDGELAGLIQATEEPEPDYRYVEVDLFLHPDRHGQGIGADALRTVLRHHFEARGHHKAIICPASANERAIRSYESVGFRPVGTLREAERAPDGPWRDALLMEMLAAELR